MKGTQEGSLRLPLALLIDLVNHLYIFSDAAREIDEDFSRWFTVSHTFVESGPWWRFIYGAGFHIALHQIAQRTRALAEEEFREVEAELSREEALHFLPYLEDVETMLAIWRHPTLPVHERKRQIASLFSEEIARVVISPGEELFQMNQFYEEGLVTRGSGMRDFFAYLDSCPLPQAQKSPVHLHEAIAYWAWIDNVKAFRTFANEEGTKNPRVVRMQQAILFYQLVERLPQRNLDFSVVSLKLSPYWLSFLHMQDLSLLALVADSHGRNRWFNYYDQIVFIEHTTLGDAFRALQSHTRPQQQHHEMSFAQKCALLLQASAINIINQQEILQERALMSKHISVDSLLIANRLMEQAKLMSETQDFRRDAPVEATSLFRDTLYLLETAKCLTDCIAESDPLSPHASAGLLFILKQMKANL